MKQPREIKPPQWAQRLLAWYCKPELLEDLQGDLNEYFERHCKSKGPWRARFIYIIDVLKFFRLYTIRKPEFINLLIHWIMIGSYIKTSGRSIVRNKLFSAINIVGLAISMSVGLILISLLLDVFSYDRFHENHGRIYRITSQHQYLGNKDNNFMATTSVRAAKAVQENFPGVESVAILHGGFGGDLTVGEKTLPLKGYWANESFFHVFTFPLIAGNPATALQSPYSVVLTEKAAHKMFGDEEAIGKTVTLNNDKLYTITGIMKDIPRFSHMSFDMLASFSTWELQAKDNRDELAWDHVWSTWAYVLMADETDLTLFQENLNQLSAREDATVKNIKIALVLQPMDEIMVGENLGNQIGHTMGKTLIFVFSALSFVVILSACFNYTNLSVARSLRRSREVGIRKVIGALKGHVMAQFVVEAVIISLLSLCAAFVIFLLVKPHFLGMSNDLNSILRLDLSLTLVVCFILFAMLVGIFAGFFPALFFAKVNAIQVLKNITPVRMFKKVTMRKVLIVFQYCISIMLITGTVIIYQQYRHFVAFDLGFSTENILNIKVQGNKAELLKKKLSELPEVKAISQSSMVTSVGSYWGATMKNPENPLDSADVFYNFVDENYIPLHEHHLVAGSNFVPHAEDAEESEIIVNEYVLKRFNVAEQNPAKAIGAILNVNGKPLKVIGVMKSFHYGQATDRMMTKEVILRYSTKDMQYLNVKIMSDDLPATDARIQALWKAFDNVHPYEGKFYDQQIEEALRGISASMKLAGFIAFLAICIASLGLLGMVVFTTETRLKEISIRKVLGATEGKLIYLLGKSFVFLLAISSVIALPITYLFFDQVLFPELGNHAPLNMTGGLVGVLCVVSIAMLMIGSQTLKVARSNPAQVLKSE